jgi:hypothetical protein
MNKPDIIDVLYDLNRELESNPLLEFVATIAIVKSKIRRERERLEEENKISDTQITNLISLYRKLTDYIKDKETDIKKLPDMSKIYSQCKITKFDELDNKVENYRLNRNQVSISDFDNLYKCIDDTLSELMDAVSKLGKSTILGTPGTPGTPAIPIAKPAKRHKRHKAPAPGAVLPPVLPAPGAPAPAIPALLNIDNTTDLITYIENNTPTDNSKVVNKYIKYIIIYKTKTEAISELKILLTYIITTQSANINHRTNIADITVKDMNDFITYDKNLGNLAIILLNLILYRKNSKIDKADTDKILDIVGGPDARDFANVVINGKTIKDILDDKISGNKIIMTPYNISGGSDSAYYKKYIKYKAKYLQLRAWNKL